MSDCSEEAISKGVDPLSPIDREQLKKDARFFMGAVTTEDLPEDVLDGIVQSCINKYEDLAIYRCEVLYCTILNSLKYLIRVAWADKGGSSSGELTSRKEKVGNVTIEDKYSNSSSSDSASGWEKMFQYFLSHPEDVCECLVKSRGKIGLVKIGGTNKAEYQRINEDPNVRSMWDIETSVDKYNQDRVRSRTRRRNNSKRFKL